MMNKGLEVIEAHWLFGLPRSRIDVVIHPQSVIHSMVEYEDGSVLAQLGNPDMRTPIAHALAFPDRVEAGVARLDLTQMAALSFEAPDLDRFPCLGLAFRALEQGGAAPIALNAANECAVERFLEGGVPFHRIAKPDASPAKY
jgi:1-deoxy-D-xylulose-5-phosphate reductoisomerase